MNNMGMGIGMGMPGPMGAGFGTPAIIGGNESTESFFGGSFFPQTEDDMDPEEKALAFVQSTVGKSEKEVFAELADL